MVGLKAIVESDAQDAEIEDNEDTAEALSNYADLLETHFPRAVPEGVLIQHATKVLGKHNFKPETSINLISTCRDEICRPFTEQLDRVWGNSFNISSLAGFCFCGRTGFKAAMAHAPVVDGIERYVFWVAPHIGLTLEGEVGKVYRPGREAASSACGAMIAVHNELKSGKLQISLDPLDLEQSLLKQQLINSLHYGHVPSLVELTYTSHETIFSEVSKLAAASTDPLKCEYVIIAGIMVHGPLGQNFFWPGKMVKYSGGVETDLYEDYAASVASSNPGAKMPSTSELQTWALNTALANLQLKRRKVRLAAVMGNVGELKRAGINLPSVTDNQRRTLLHIAAMHGQLEVAQLLLQLDPTIIDKQDINHLTAIDYAVEGGHEDVADVLSRHGGGLHGDRLREHFVRAVEACDVVAFRRYYRYAREGQEAVAEATDKDGRSLMHICLAAAKSGRIASEAVEHKAMLQALFECGADWGADMDFFGNNVITEAQRSCPEDVSRQVAEKLLSPAHMALRRSKSFSRSFHNMALDPSQAHPAPEFDPTSPAGAGRARSGGSLGGVSGTFRNEPLKEEDESAPTAVWGGS